MSPRNHKCVVLLGVGLVASALLCVTLSWRYNRENAFRVQIHSSPQRVTLPAGEPKEVAEVATGVTDTHVRGVVESCYGEALPGGKVFLHMDETGDVAECGIGLQGDFDIVSHAQPGLLVARNDSWGQVEHALNRTSIEAPIRLRFEGNSRALGTMESSGLRRIVNVRVFRSVSPEKRIEAEGAIATYEPYPDSTGRFGVAISQLGVGTFEAEIRFDRQYVVRQRFVIERNGDSVEFKLDPRKANRLSVRGSTIRGFAYVEDHPLLTESIYWKAQWKFGMDASGVVQTNDLGAFEFSSYLLEAGTTIQFAYRPGFDPFVVGAIPEDSNFVELEVRFTRSDFKWAGVLMTDSGDAVPFATVVLNGVTNLSNADGLVSFEGLVGKQVHARVGVQKYSTTAAREFENESVPIEVPPGDVKWQDILFEVGKGRALGFLFDGVVDLSRFVAIASVTPSASGDQGRWNRLHVIGGGLCASLTGLPDRGSIDVLAGSWEFTPGGVTYSFASRRIDIESVNGSVVSVTVAKCRSLPVRVLDHLGNPVVGARVALSPDFFSLTRPEIVSGYREVVSSPYSDLELLQDRLIAEHGNGEYELRISEGTDVPVILISSLGASLTEATDFANVQGDGAVLTVSPGQCLLGQMIGAPSGRYHVRCRLSGGGSVCGYPDPDGRYCVFLGERNPEHFGIYGPSGEVVQRIPVAVGEYVLTELDGR